MIELDTAGFYGAEAQEEGVIGGSHIPSQIGAIKVRQSAILRARMHGIKLGELHEQADRLRVTLRELNRFLTEVMEGARRTGQEAFSDFLISLAAGYSALPEEYAGVLGLYIKLSYGDNSNTRVIPFDLGTKVAFLSGETARLTHEAARLQAEERHTFEKRYKEENWASFYSNRKTARGRREGMKNIIAKAVAIKFNGGSPWGFLRHWPKEDNGWGLAQVVAERAGYGGIACVYYENYYFGGWSEIDHFAPLMDYPNNCAVDFSPGKSGKEALDVLRRSKDARSYMDSVDVYRRKDVSERRKRLQARWGYFSRERPAAARTWEGLDAVGRWYLLMRACDWVMYGKEFADRSFPDPSNSDYSAVVSALVWLFEEHEAELIKKLEDAEEVEKREYIEKHCAESVENIVVSPPEQLTARVLDTGQIQTVRDACIEEIKHGPQAVYEVAGTIDEFAVFCKRLAQPENRVKARHVNTRSEADMVNEMARVLTSIPKYTAYLKLVQERGGESIVWRGSVRPSKLSSVSAGAPETARLAIEKRALDYTRPREEIREEIARRQEKWRRRVSVEAPSGATAEKKPVDAPKQGVAPPDEEAPPPRMVPSKEDGGEEAGGQAPENAGKVRLVYRSDFTKPTGWDENHSEAVKVFRLNGYYHIIVFDTNHYVYFNPPIIMDNFRAQVEAEFTAQTGENGECGLVFGAKSVNGENFYHMFGIRPDGNYRLYARVSKEYRRATDWIQSEFINRGDRTNSLMVERSGKEITVGINGSSLVTVISDEVASGFVGMFVRTPKDGYYAEARFRNLLLYAIE